MNKDIYIIGDVHGCYKTLVALLEKIPKEAEVVFVGDLIDRGPGSAEVIQLIKDKKYDCVLGNHELMMINDLPNLTPNKESFWEQNGGDTTLNSYQKEPYKLKEDYDWLCSLPLFIHYKNFKDEKGRELVVSHSVLVHFYEDLLELNKKIISLKDKNSSEYLETLTKYNKLVDATLWGRTFPKIKEYNYFNVFGHTPTEYMFQTIPNLTVKENVCIEYNAGYANVDTGCVYNKTMSALAFPSMKVISQKNID